MQSGALASFLSNTLQIKTGTVLDYGKLLRAADLLNKGNRGRYAGARMTTSDAINWLIALVLDHQRGDDVAGNVRRVRGLSHDEPPTILPPGFTTGLTGFNAATAGKALENLLDDIRAGRMDSWAAGEKYKLAASFESRGQSVFLSIQRDNQRGIQSFTAPGYAKRSQALIERNVTIYHELFLQLAEKLGPPPS
jgi:hypothetical protein